ncbi:hypothetical protein [Microbacterium sp. 77mftsu3.1]|uniref:hypothetical protein n=1 Tax=Microbacterium sp. 77mftsu3.1 TaxID=1761802 RepID=UPI000382A67F|nr:hypothetical protein [Microbacterium sp. 77mftsu3.1]SDH55292.1 hypothetical protein SAMN04488590_3557 [Microbacterium sp. 77mftsu3.1]
MLPIALVVLAIALVVYARFAEVKKQPGRAIVSGISAGVFAATALLVLPFVNLDANGVVETTSTHELIPFTRDGESLLVATHETEMGNAGVTFYQRTAGGSDESSSLLSQAVFYESDEATVTVVDRVTPANWLWPFDVQRAGSVIFHVPSSMIGNDYDYAVDVLTGR